MLLNADHGTFVSGVGGFCIRHANIAREKSNIALAGSNPYTTKNSLGAIVSAKAFDGNENLKCSLKNF